VLDADTFTIPQYFVDNDPQAGVWVILNEANRYSATTDVGAAVSLTLRANPEEDYFIYNANPSAFLQGLAVGERHTNRFYYAVEDSHGAIGIGPIDVVVDGVNNIPAPQPDPGSIGGLDPLVTPSNSLTQVLTTGLDLMYTLPPVSGRSNRVDLQVLDLSGLLPGTVVIDDIFTTDEDTALPIVATNLVLNDTDVDRTDLLVVTAVDTLSREGAPITFNSGLITYQPSGSTNLQALAREEMVIDTFTVRVSDGQPNGTVTSLVAVLVVGVNDTPVANPVFLTTHEDEVLVFDPRTNDVEIDINQAEPDNRLRVVSVTNWPNPGQADVDMSTTNVTHDAPASQLLNQLADWQSFTNVFNYTITDNSFLFATDDEFYVPAGTVGRVLGVLVNDRDFTDAAGVLTIIDAGPTLHGGTVTISTNGQSLVYSSPVGYVGDDYFRYTIQNDRGDIDHARVLVRSVVAAINGVLHAADDHYLVAAGETAVMPVLANDQMLPLNGAGLTITALLSTSMPGQPVLTNNTFVYVATNGLTPLTFRYEVSGGGTARAEAEVTLGVVERRGTLNIQDDAFSVLPGSFDNELDVLVNDGLVTESISALRIGAIPGPAAHGLLTTNAAGTRLVYTPTSGFIGVERVAYLAVDQAGGTATGWVDIAVGKLDVAPDFYKVAATTNPVPVLLDVLANDRIQPAVRGSLTLLSVTPSTPTTNGTLSVGGAGAYLLFTPSNTLGQMEFDYVVQDGGVSPRVATGRVTLATVASGTYANPDTYLVRGGGANYVLNVLTNDRGYPALNRTYSILSIGTGPNAPDHGGSVSIVGDSLVYTPAVGFFGEESFTYVMSDSMATDVARVTVSVRRGDLHANDDVYAVYYALAPGTNVAVSFNLPVLLNDRILPPLDQVMTLSALGAGTNAPDQGGVVQIAPDLQSLVYRPVLATTTGYVEQFTYEYTDGGDRRASAVVRVHVQNRASNLVALTQADAFTVARSSSNNLLPVLANDFVLPGSAAGWSVTAVSPSLFGASVSISNAAARYTPAPGFVGVDTFTYSVSDGLGGTGSATVSVRVGSLPTLPDRFSVLSGTTGNDFDVVSNDVLVTTYADEYPLHSVFGANAGGALALSGHNTVLYAPAASHVGGYPYTETFFYRVADESGVLVTGEVQVTVHDAASDRDTSTITLLVEGRNDQPVIANAAPLLQITDKEYVKPFPQVLITEVDQQLQEPIDVSVQLGLPEQGLFRNLDGFVQAAPGYYVLTNTTAAWATARLRDLIFEPTENRITVPTSEDTRFTIQVTDNKSAPVVDTNSVVTVTAVNDAPEILGTRAGQRVYARLPIRLFSSVTIREVDNLTLQPLDITITMNARTNGSITNLTPFVLSTTGVYRATNITAAAASSALRAMEFWVATNLFPTSTQLLTQFSIAVSDRFAAVVQDSVTTVIAYDAPEGLVRPTNVTMRGSFGIAVDTLSDYAVVGAPNAGAKGTNAGAAFVYQRNPGSSNTWTEWRVLQPSQVETNDRFGRSVAISDDYLAVGAINDEVGGVEVGSVYLYQRHLGGTNNWGEWIRITPTNITNAIRFGYALDLEGDTLVVGAPDAQLAGGIITQGAVFVFSRDAGGPDAWGEVARRVPTDPGLTNAEFGFSVALSGDQLMVGAPKLNVNLTTTAREGAVFQFARDEGGPNAWGPVRRLTAVETNLSVEFGWDVALDGSVLAIGAPGMTAGAVTNAGRVYVYTMPVGGTQWLATVTLDRRNDNERRFGNGLGLKGERLLVGAPYNNGAQNLGAAYLYRLDPLTSTNWILLDIFRRPAGSTAGLFGTAVGLDADAGIVGAPADFSDVSNRGFAYLYRFKQNNAPMLVAPVADQVAPLGVPYGFPIPGGTFADPDVDDALTLSATFPSGSNGLAFTSLTVTGTPEAVGLTPVALRATDESGASASQTFDVIVVDGISLLGSRRDLWNLDRFGNAVTNPALAGSLWGGGANPDGDELDNDQEYVFGGDPSVPEDRRIGLASSGDGHLLITYFRRTDDPDLLYMLQGSSHLRDWADLNWTVVSETAVPWSDGLEYVTIKVTVDALTPYQHYRIIVLW
jgi:VCBS repeat-containing protein